MQRARTQYVRSDDGASIAYQVIGDAPRDLLFLPPTFYANVEYLWSHPLPRHAFDRLTRFARLILVDRRGAGLSDPVCAPVTLDRHVADLRAVLDAAGSDRTAILACNEGSITGALLAATFPERFSSLILFSSFVTRGTDPDRVRSRYDVVLNGWGTAGALDTIAPSLAGDAEFREWWAGWERQSASPATLRHLLHGVFQIDLRPVLEAIQVPTLVTHRSGDRTSHVRNGRKVADAIPGARFLELPGQDGFPWSRDADALIDAVEEFVTGERRPPRTDRALATVLFTDIVGSTERAATLGDERWRALLEDHDRTTRAVVAEHDGRVVKSLGDGVLAVFDAPTRAVRAARALHDAVRPFEIELRAGLHTGECELLDGNDLGGIAVHIGARVASLAGPGEVLVSSTVRDLVAGSGLTFADRGMHELKGVPEPWHVLAVEVPTTR